MRIALIVATFPPYHGGTGNACYQNARELAQRGHDVHVFTVHRAGYARIERREGMTIHRLRPLLAYGNAALLPGLSWSLRGFDLIHLHYPFFGGEFTTLASLIWRTPLVITYQHDVHLAGLPGLIERVMRRTAVRATLHRAARIVFSSLDYAAASHIRPLLPQGQDRIDAIPNGVDIAIFKPDTPTAREGVGSSTSGAERSILLVAGLDHAHYFKGIGVLLKAVATLPTTAHLTIVGDGDLRPEYEERARALGIGHRTQFAGRVTDDALPNYYRRADVTVLPSVTMGEAFGMVLVESLACGTPVIATDLPGVRTVVDHESTGLLVPPGDAGRLGAALARLLDDDATRERYGREGVLQVHARYTWGQIGDQLERLYRIVLRDHQREGQYGILGHATRGRDRRRRLFGLLRRVRTGAKRV